ncbi:unnamed protein product [Haemonchus placei]|uniref:Endo/exonuclease/phosphatase domain-containing protein n=1 Tax=Haemonchus placei TaxID=6290 RepID=A0A0N4W6G2_HAEPC|nr:unnamed protein product [Haemonchus placei]
MEETWAVSESQSAERTSGRLTEELGPLLAILGLRIDKHTTVSIIYCYAPTSTAIDGEKNSFHKELEKISKIERSYYKYVVGDFNAIIHEERPATARTEPPGIGETEENGEPFFCEALGDRRIKEHISGLSIASCFICHESDANIVVKKEASDNVRLNTIEKAIKDENEEMPTSPCVGAVTESVPTRNLLWILEVWQHVRCLRLSYLLALEWPYLLAFILHESSLRLGCDVNESQTIKTTSPVASVLLQILHP